MAERTYPYNAWTLSNRSQPRVVIIVSALSYGRGQYDKDTRGRIYHRKDSLFDTLPLVAAAAHNKLREREEKARKMIENIEEDKRKLDAWGKRNIEPEQKQ